jgi:hypothetical protein
MQAKKKQPDTQCQLDEPLDFNYNQSATSQNNREYGDKRLQGYMYVMGELKSLNQYTDLDKKLETLFEGAKTIIGSRNADLHEYALGLLDGIKMFELANTQPNK